MAQRITIGFENFYLETCYRCETPFCMDETTYSAADRGKEKFTFYCPFGHGQHYVSGETTEQKLRRERDRLQQQLAYKDDVIRDTAEERDAARRSASAYKGKVTHLKNSVAAGQCPCCDRTFKRLRSHMAKKHPEFKLDEAA